MGGPQEKRWKFRSCPPQTPLRKPRLESGTAYIKHVQHLNSFILPGQRKYFSNLLPSPRIRKCRKLVLKNILIFHKFNLINIFERKICTWAAIWTADLQLYALVLYQLKLIDNYLLLVHTTGKIQILHSFDISTISEYSHMEVHPHVVSANLLGMCETCLWEQCDHFQHRMWRYVSLLFNMVKIELSYFAADVFIQQPY